MKIHTFNVATYKNCRIYFRHFGDIFEYMFIARSQIFTDNVRVIPGLKGRVMRAVGKWRTAVSEEQLHGVISFLMGKARDRIDYVLSKEWEKDQRAKEKNKELAQKAARS